MKMIGLYVAVMATNIASWLTEYLNLIVALLGVAAMTYKLSRERIKHNRTKRKEHATTTHTRRSDNG
jgi:uncharacterized membrane protein SirB2